jgi:hypothetical protein
MLANHTERSEQLAINRCLENVDRRLGVSRRFYATGWWALALWNVAAVFNVYSRTQQWGFALPLAPDFKEVPSTYGVAAIGALTGAVLLWIVLGVLWFYARQWGRCFGSWTGRIPSPSAEVNWSSRGRLVPFIQAATLVIVIGFPLVGQVHFADKFLAGTSTVIGNGVHAVGWRDHLLKWVPRSQACADFIYDGKENFAYCEFYEPWAVTIFVALSFFATGAVVYGIFWPRLLART